MTTPCSARREACHQLVALGTAHFHVRAAFSEGDDFNAKDQAIGFTLDNLETLITKAAKRLVNADRAHAKHMEKLRREARQQVESEE
jgi:hypothetical protein